MLPGQHLTVQTTGGPRDRRAVLERAYTPWPDWDTAITDNWSRPAGAPPSKQKTFDIVVKVYPKGPMSMHLHGLQVGERLKFRMPLLLCFAFP